jgi:integrase
LRSLLEWTFTACEIEPNPALWRRLKPHVRTLDIETQHFAAMPFGEVPALMRDLAAYNGRNGRDGGAAVSRCLRFCILTATRTGEAIGCDWSEIDLAKREWTIPKGRTKKGRAHVVPLSDAALALLGERSTGLVFKVGNTMSGKIDACGLNRLLHLYRSGVTVHGFRSAFRDWATEAGYRHDVCESALAHVSGNSTVQAYLRTDLLDKRRELMDAWAEFITA